MNPRRHSIVDLLFILTLFGVFALSSLALVFLGGEVYRHTVTDMRNNYDTRACATYITEKIHQSDEVPTLEDGTTFSPISVVALGDAPALLLTQVQEDSVYYTYLYYYDGYLRELFTSPNSQLGNNPALAGRNVFHLSAFEIKQSTSNLITINLTTEAGISHQILVTTRCQAAQSK